MQKLGSFHATIVLAIERVTMVTELECLGQLIRETVIPKNHDAIIAAWSAKFDQLNPNLSGEPTDFDQTTQNLLSESEFLAKLAQKKQEESCFADWLATAAQ